MNNFDLIAGYEREKEELKKICEILNNRVYYIMKGAKMPKGLIFYGGAGTGKTLFTRVLAMECNLPLNIIDFGKAVDDNSVLKQIKKAFEKAKKSKKYSIIYIDELDKILPDLSQDYISDHSKIILTQLLTLIDGIDENSNVFFVASCNNYGCIPETMVRPGRIDKKIMLDNPDYNSRKEIAEYYINKTDCKFKISPDEIAGATSGFSCAGLETLVNECVLASDDKNIVNQDLVYSKIREIKNEDIEREKSEKEKRLITCHLLGQFLIAKTFNDGDYLLEIDDDSVGNDFFNGMINSSCCEDDYDDYDEDEEDEKEENLKEPNSYYCYQDYENLVTVLFGGMVAEKLVYGHSFNNVSGDLYNIDDALLDASENGMLVLDYYYDNDRIDRLEFSQVLRDKLNEKLLEIKKSCLKKAEEILTPQIDTLKILQESLIRQGVLKKNEVEEILKNQKENQN